jgi:type I restriction enzyme M protein
MNAATHSKIVSFIWGIADDVLRGLFTRGQYRDVILPMTVLRRLDSVLEPTKQAVLAMKEVLDGHGIAEQDAALRQAAGQDFYNTSPFTLRDLRSIGNQTKLRQDFEAYLDGFSQNVQDILENSKLRNQIPDLSKADRLGALIEKFLDPAIDLSPSGLDNHGMGSVFEELLRRFNEANNEEAGEYWTPRDVIRLMTRLIFDTVADTIPEGSYLLYDGAMGTGGMLTVAEDTLKELAEARGKRIKAHLYGQETQPQTFAIAKADLLIKGEGEAADNIVGGTEFSTLSNDAFGHMKFDFMLSNPPYGLSWSVDQAAMGGKKGIRDPRFIVTHAGDSEFSLVTRSSDGQMLFLANLVSKMKETERGSRMAEIHNGSSLFTGDAGQGESNIRRYVIENDWLEAIVALPLNLFYNTGIATYVWVLSNRKEERRRGKVQLIDATKWFTPLRKNLGSKNCELSAADVEKIMATFQDFEAADAEVSKVFDNAAFGYYKVLVERPLRIKAADAGRAYSPAEIKKLLAAGERDESAPAVIGKIHKPGTVADPIHGLFEATVDGKPRIVEFAPDKELSDTEQIPLAEPAGEWRDGVEAFVRREVLPYAADAWVAGSKTKIGYEVSFTRHFYKPTPMRTLDEIRADIRALEAETDDLLSEIVG